jgi:inorganic pyrophosphatase
VVVVDFPIMFHHIKIGLKFPKIINVIVEIPTNTGNKYEYDEELDLIKLDRVLHSPMHYPVDYGFIPETRSSDGDHLDIMVLTNSPVFTGCLLEVRPVGALIMSDENGLDEKILAVPLRAPYYNHIHRLKDVSPHLLDELVHFFSEYKTLEKKEEKVKIIGWVNRLEAYKIIRQAYKTFRIESKT